MIWLPYIAGGLGIVSSTLFVLLVVSAYYNWKFARIILEVEDSIEESLDILDEKYNILTQIAEKEIFFDSPEVRQAVMTIQASRIAVLSVANSLASIDKKAVEELENTGGS